MLRRIYGAHPALVGFLLAGGAFAVLWSGYALMHPPSPGEEALTNAGLVQLTQWGILVLGGIAWLTGGVLFGRIQGWHWLAALGLHLLPGIGLILMRCFGGSQTPHQAWARQYQEMDGREVRKTYKPMKPLY